MADEAEEAEEECIACALAYFNSLDDTYACNHCGGKASEDGCIECISDCANIDDCRNHCYGKCKGYFL